MASTKDVRRARAEEVAAELRSLGFRSATAVSEVTGDGSFVDLSVEDAEALAARLH